MKKLPVNFNLKRIKMFRNELILAVIGAGLLLGSGLFVADKSVNTSDADSSSVDGGTDIVCNDSSYALTEAERLKSFLKGINGVGNVDVLIYVNETAKTVHASESDTVKENTDESDSNGGKRQNSTLDEKIVYKVVRDADGNECLVPLYLQYPEIKGVLISAEGADNNIVKESIIEAVSRLYDIPVHKISVMKKASGKIK